MHVHFCRTNHLQLHCSAKGTTDTTRGGSASLPPGDPVKEAPAMARWAPRWAAMPPQPVLAHLPGHLPWREAAGEHEISPLVTAMDSAAVPSPASHPAVGIPVIVLMQKWLIAYLWEKSLSWLPCYISPLSDCLNTDCEVIFKLLFCERY